MPPMNSTFLLGMLVGAGLLGLGLFLGAAASSPSPDSSPADQLRARQIAIVDEVGTELMVLGGSQSGGSISVRDRIGRTMLVAGAGPQGGIVAMNRHEDGRRALNLRATGAGGALDLFDDRENRSVILQSDPDDSHLELRHHRGETRPRIRLDFSERNSGTLRLSSREHDLVRLGAHGLGGGQIETFRADGERQIALTVTREEQGQLVTFDSGGKPLVQLTATPDRVGQIYTYGPEGEPWIALASHPTGPSLRLFSPEGHPAVVIESDDEGAGEIGLWSKDGPGQVIRP